MNLKIRHHGLSAREILYQRDAQTNKQLDFEDKTLASEQHAHRLKNHKPSALSKSRGASKPQILTYSTGNLVYIKADRTKTTAREPYMIMDIQHGNATLRKFSRQNLQDRQYLVPLDRLILVPSQTQHPTDTSQTMDTTSSSSDEEYEPVHGSPLVVRDGSHESHTCASQLPTEVSTYPHRTIRNRTRPRWMDSDDWIMDSSSDSS